MNLVRVGLVGLFCALVGTGVATAANGNNALNTAGIAPAKAGTTSTGNN